MDYIGMRYGNRVIVANTCDDRDWTDIGLKVPTCKNKYKLTKCLNCGHIIPCMMRNLTENPPKRCVFCSNIGNHSSVKTETNAWTVFEDYAICNVVYKDKIIGFCIDIDDYDTANQFVWRIAQKKQKYYVISGSVKKGTAVYLHTLIYGIVDDGYEIDHIDGNSLNNRRSNLRVVTHQENIDNQRATRIDNQIGIRGITYNKSSKQYKVDFHYHGVRYYTKDWHTIEEAVWCRTCFEDHFGLHAIRSNPLTTQYDTLSKEQKESINTYVQEIILRNER